MILIGKKTIESTLDDLIKTRIGDVLHELDPKKTYILIVPETLEMAEINEAFQSLPDNLNLVVLRANGVKLLELSH